MKIQFWTVGKPHESHVKEGTELFTKRISHYYPIQWNIIPTPKNAGLLSEAGLKKEEGEIVLQLLKKEDYLILLEEEGKQFSSEELADFLDQRANASTKSVVFLIGGVYGVSKEVMMRADFKWSLSKLVFPHQLVRFILAEQVYRACTILRNEKYHHA